MRIAVPTNDGSSVSAHFGRSSAFLVFHTDDGEIKSRESRVNPVHHDHAQGECGHHSAAGEGHSHAGILSAIAGCDIVICAGMGWRAAEALKSGGITPIIADCRGSAETVVIAYLNGTLVAGNGPCGCNH